MSEKEKCALRCLSQLKAQQLGHIHRPIFTVLKEFAKMVVCGVCFCGTT